MTKIIRIGMDTSKSVFQLHGVDESEQPVMRRKLSRRAMLEFFRKLAPTVVGIEACGGSHHWVRVLEELGHEVKLMAPQYVKPYLKRGKNDAADAEAICEAMSRPMMRFVPAKSVDQQADQMLLGMRDRLVRLRTQIMNTIRGYAMEFGHVVPKGHCHIEPLLLEIDDDKGVPSLVKEFFSQFSAELASVEKRIAAIDEKLKAYYRQNELCHRLADIPGIGVVGATLLAAKATDVKAFKSGRDFAAWIGLTPKDHSTAGRVRLGSITKAGDASLRSVLVVGATSVIQQAKRSGVHKLPWLEALLKRKPGKLAAVALANKTARIAWRLMVSGERYRPMQAASGSERLTALAIA